MAQERGHWIGRALNIALVAGALGLAAWVGWTLYSRTYVFSDLAGPAEATSVAPAVAAQVADFDRGSPHRMAVLVTDPESDWLGLLRGFRALGVPVRFTRDPAAALQHRVVLVYPIVSGKVLSGPELRALAGHVHAGGTLLAFDLAGGGLGELFGVDGYAPSQSRELLTWARAGGVPEEDTIRVNRESKLWTLGYAAAGAQVLASFDDGSTAVACRESAGMACVMGLDLGRLAQLGMDGRAEPINRHFVNAYEPTLDVLLRWVRDLYVAREPVPWLLSTVPGDREVSLLVTHDVDYGGSVANTLEYAQALAERGATGTFFIQTKYRRDFNDEVFFDDTVVPVLEGLKQAGMEVASHSVSHSVVFKAFPMGSGDERYPDYRPTVQSRGEADGATVLGELRVSRFLLETLAGTDIPSFRPGHLSYPFALPEALRATGFRYSSSLTANGALTHLPYQLTHSRAGRALVPVHEFPVTIEDELPPPLGQRFEQAQAVIEKIARHQGLVVFLNHPNVTGDKLDFEKRLVEAWKTRAWIGRLDAFGAWWQARDALEVDIRQQDGAWTLTASGPQPIEDLVVHLPKSRVGKLTLTVTPGEPFRHALP